MTRDAGVPSVRVVAPALLVVGVLVATVFFMRGQPVGGGGVADGGAMSGAVAPADAAHAGVGVGADMGGVAQRFQVQVQALRAQLDAAPSDRSLVLRLAQLLHDGHDVPGAVPLYRRAITLDPTDPQPYYDLASAYGSLGEWDHAADVLEERLDRDSRDAVALYDLGAVRANQGNTEEAKRLLGQAREATTDGETLARISQALARLKGS